MESKKRRGRPPKSSIKSQSRNDPNIEYDSDNDPGWNPRDRRFQEFDTNRQSDSPDSRHSSKKYKVSSTTGFSRTKPYYIEDPNLDPYNQSKRRYNNDERHAFRKGAFLIAKHDIVSFPECPIWRVDGPCLLQKYEPITLNEGTQKAFRKTLVFSGWSNTTRKNYKPVAVQILLQVCRTIELIGVTEILSLDNVPSTTPLTNNNTNNIVSSTGRDQYDKSDTSQYKAGLSVSNASNGETIDPNDENAVSLLFAKYPILNECADVYLQLSLSSAIHSGFLEMVLKENDEYFVKPYTNLEEFNQSFINSLESLPEFQSKFSSDFKDLIKKYSDLVLAQLASIMTASHTHSCLICGTTDPIYKVSFTGQSYEYDTLKISDENLQNIDVYLCLGCVEMVQLYHRLYHARFHLYDESVKQVKSLRESQTDISATELLETCLFNQAWKYSVFKEYVDTWDATTTLLQKYQGPTTNLDMSSIIPNNTNNMTNEVFNSENNPSNMITSSNTAMLDNINNNIMYNTTDGVLINHDPHQNLSTDQLSAENVDNSNNVIYVIEGADGQNNEISSEDLLIALQNSGATFTTNPDGNITILNAETDINPTVNSIGNESESMNVNTDQQNNPTNSLNIDNEASGDGSQVINQEDYTFALSSSGDGTVLQIPKGTEIPDGYIEITFEQLQQLLGSDGTSTAVIENETSFENNALEQNSADGTLIVQNTEERTNSLELQYSQTNDMANTNENLSHQMPSSSSFLLTSSSDQVVLNNENYINTNITGNNEAENSVEAAMLLNEGNGGGGEPTQEVDLNAMNVFVTQDEQGNQILCYYVQQQEDGSIQTDAQITTTAVDNNTLLTNEQMTFDQQSNSMLPTSTNDHMQDFKNTDNTHSLSG